MHETQSLSKENTMERSVIEKTEPEIHLTEHFSVQTDKSDDNNHDEESCSTREEYKPDDDSAMNSDTSGSDEEKDVRPSVRVATGKTMAEKLTVAWILDNFEPSEGSSLKRSVLFNLYREHCLNEGSEPINAASFGKLIRSVFVGIKTRRLGTRGNSKYHYYGVKVSDRSPLKNRAEFQCEEWLPDNRRVQNRNSYGQIKVEQPNVDATTMKQEPTFYPNFDLATMNDAFHVECRNSHATSAFLMTNQQISEAGQFIASYKQHLKDLTNAVLNKYCNQVGYIIHNFWQIYRPVEQISSSGNFENRPSADSNNCVHISGLSVSQINELLNNDQILAILRRLERRTNQTIAQILIPDPLRLQMKECENDLGSFIDRFAEWSRAAVTATPSKFQNIKVENSFHLVVTVNNRINIARLLTRAASEIRSPMSLSNITADFESLNRNLIAASICWTIEDDPRFIGNMDENISLYLKSSQSIDSCVRRLLGYGFAFAERFRAEPREYQRACRTMVNNWNSYSSSLLKSFLITAPDSCTFFGSLLSGMGNYLLQEMAFKHETAMPLLSADQMDLTKMCIF
ncbi:hypothetical protein ACOME3_006698 [Neoechinorhynchus agilis]